MVAPKAAPNTSENEEESVDWLKVAQGILVSSGSVYFLGDHIPASILIWIGVLFSSPLLFIMGILGATLGSLGGM